MMVNSTNSRAYLNDFGGVLAALQDGESVFRTGWNANHRLTLQVPDEHSKMTQPYIYITTFQGAVVPWVASQTDLLATDWNIYDGQTKETK